MIIGKRRLAMWGDYNPHVVFIDHVSGIGGTNRFTLDTVRGQDPQVAGNAR
ncbi:hypothetical protein [Glycomyces paridis]|uniref:hypothetical protein n=1 Tax=Glycomyces paridis TaxID=2126555 RepID=UPI00195D2E7B|nr:hypothetical protein [Glycomyces paridis]